MLTSEGNVYNSKLLHPLTNVAEGVKDDSCGQNICQTHLIMGCTLLSKCVQMEPLTTWVEITLATPVYARWFRLFMKQR